MQVKLLRVLQEREIRRVGENKSRKVDVRVLAATNRDLAHGVAGGTFRQDLYYRLKVVELHVPPLRERRDDILPLARVLLADAALRMKRKISGLAPRAADQLLRYEWPGNVRELENAMERAVALARGTRVELEDLPEEVRQAFLKPIATSGTVRPLDEIEKEYILAALELNGGNQTRTAEQLHIGVGDALPQAQELRRDRRQAGGGCVASPSRGSLAGTDVGLGHGAALPVEAGGARQSRHPRRRGGAVRDPRLLARHCRHGGHLRRGRRPGRHPRAGGPVRGRDPGRRHGRGHRPDDPGGAG